MEKPNTTTPPIDLAALGPTKCAKGGRVVLDTYNHLPNRFISLEEAKALGLEHFYDGTPCRYSHVAPRYVVNPDQCVDCARIRRGKAPIGGSARNQSFYKERKPAATPAAAPVIVAPSADPEVDKADKPFLAAYAEFRDLTQAAQAVGTTSALVEARRACNAALDKAMTALEERLQIKRALPAPAAFEWTAEKERHLATIFVDTGDLAVARDSIGCTPSQYYQHLASSGSFADTIAQAEPLAARSFLERATSLGLAGNERLLQKLLQAHFPEQFSDRVKVDLNVSKLEKLSDDELNQQSMRRAVKFITAAGYKLVRADAVVIDGEAIEVTPGAEAPLALPARGAGPSRETGGNAARPAVNDTRSESGTWQRKSICI